MFTPAAKKISFVCFCALFCFFAYRHTFFSKLKSVEKPLVAITQIVPHPSLDAIRQGITDTLSKAHIDVIFQDAQGNVATAAQIAQRFVALSPTVIVPITTPSTQPVYVLARHKKIPVVFAGVTDPVSAKLSQILGAENDIAGVCDMPPIRRQAELIQETIHPRMVGIVYNPGEPNSAIMVELMTQALEKLGISVVKSAAPTTTQVSSATRALIGRVQAIYIPNDNTIISALESVLHITHDSKIPVFSSDGESVERGALMSYAPNQYAMGQQVGEMIISLIHGKPLKDIGVQQAQKLELIINEHVAKNLKITIPPSIMRQAQKIFNSPVKEVRKRS